MAARTTRGASKRRSGYASRQVTLVSRTVLCDLSGVSERELRQWEHEEILTPAQILPADGGLEPFYEASAFERIRLIRTLAEDLEVNLPGISVILRLLDQMSGH